MRAARSCATNICRKKATYKPNSHRADCVIVRRGKVELQSTLDRQRDWANKWSEDMSSKSIALMTAIVVCFGVFVAAPARAQSSTGPYWGGSVTQHHQWIYRMMKDMTDQMGKMNGLMLRGELTPDQRRQTAQRMRQMSTMMRRLSGLEARPAIGEGKWKKQTDQMRRQMDEMTADSRTTPNG